MTAELNEVADLSEDEAHELLSPEDAVYLPPVRFGFLPFDRHGSVAAVTVDFPAMAQLVRKGEVSVERYGIEMPTEGLEVWHAHMHTSLCELNVRLVGSPENWIESAMNRFAITFVTDDPDETVFLLSGEMHRFHKGIVLPTAEVEKSHHARAVGRNDPCWCDSGLKFKHCHGR